MRVITLFICFIFISTLNAQTNAILIDGVFEDWQSISPSHSDPSGDNGFSSIDFGKLWFSHDANFLFIHLEVSGEITLQESNDIILYLDTDNNAETGTSTNGLGAELVFNFGNRSGTVRLGGNSYNVSHDDVWLVTAPTVTSRAFEIALGLDATFSGLPLFDGSVLKAVFKNNISNGDRIPDSDGVIYQFDNEASEDIPAYSISKPSESYLRIMSYNVLTDNLFENFLFSNYSRIFKAIEPDIIGFEEIYNHSSGQTANIIESMLPSENGAEWFHARVNPDIIAISRYPIISSHLIPGPGGNGAFLIDLNPVYNSQLLFIVAHTPCCNNDFDRQQEIDAIMAFVRDAKAGTGPISLEDQTPIVISGDMNLVGNQQQLETLLTGNIVNTNTYGPAFAPDWDGSELGDAAPVTTNLPMNFTWYKTSSSFSPGKLDYIIYTETALTLKNSYTLFTPALSPVQLSNNNLSSSDVINASDHLPVVADFELNPTSSLNSIVSNRSIELNITPNPVNKTTIISFTISKASTINLAIFDQQGKQVDKIFQGKKQEGEHQIDLARKNLPAGIYFCRLKTDYGTISKKVIFD